VQEVILQKRQENRVKTRLQRNTAGFVPKRRKTLERPSLLDGPFGAEQYWDIQLGNGGIQV
jgi:hypothetical protein